MTNRRQGLATAVGVALLLLAAILVMGVEDERTEGGDAGGRRTGSRSKAAVGHARGEGRGQKSSRSRSKSEHQGAIYSGPGGLVGWIQSTGSTEPAEPDPKLPWDFVDGKLISSSGGGIAREIATPSRSKISFKLEWSKSLRFRILWAADSGESTSPNNAYDLVLQRRFVYIRKRWMQTDSGGSRIVGQANAAALAEGQEALFEFYLDRGLGLVSLYINGERVHDFLDKDPGVGAFGDWLQFVSEDFYPVQISELVVQSWSGILPDGQRGEESVDEQIATTQRLESLKPVAPWAPEVEYQEVLRRGAVVDRVAQNTGDSKAVQEASQAAMDAKRRLDEAMSQLPVAEPDPERPGHVINPYTGQSLDVRGARGRIRDPSDPDPEHTFRVP